eukprot:gene24651-29987_t
METIRKCPLCALNKRAKTVKTITAIRADEIRREESWDYSDSDEGTYSILHSIESPGGWQRVYNVNTEKVSSFPLYMLLCIKFLTYFPFIIPFSTSLLQLYVVAAALMQAWDEYDAPTITTSKLIDFANTGPYILDEFLGKTAARLRDVLWGQALPERVTLTRLSLFRRRGTKPVPQFEDILRTEDKPKLDVAYAAQDTRLQELQADLANRPDAPVCTSCKKKMDRLHAKHMCKACYTKFANNRAK